MLINSATGMAGEYRNWPEMIIWGLALEDQVSHRHAVANSVGPVDLGACMDPAKAKIWPRDLQNAPSERDLLVVE